MNDTWRIYLILLTIAAGGSLGVLIRIAGLLQDIVTLMGGK